MDYAEPASPSDADYTVPGEDAMSLAEVVNDTFRVRFYDGYITEMFVGTLRGR